MDKKSKSNTTGPGRGLLRAVWGLMTPDAFDSVPPTLKGLRYRDKRPRGIAPRVDVYLPPGPGPHPSVVLVHGGGFIIGARDMKPMRFLSSALVGAGFAVASMDYRMVFRGGRFEEAQDDVTEMVRWWFANAERFSLDLGRVNTVGTSAGSALMLMSLQSTGIETIRRAVSVYGLHDFGSLEGWLVRWLRSRVLRSQDPAVWAAHSPLGRSQLAAPLLILHGTGDTVVPVAQATALAQARAAASLPTELWLSEDAPHGFFNEGSSPAANAAIARLLSFLQA